MNILDPAAIGCGRKLPPATLYQLNLSIYGSSRPDLLSDFHVHVHHSGTTLVSSLDKVNRFTSDDELFVSACIGHCENDVIVGLSRPVTYSVALGFTEVDVDNGRHFTISKAVAYEVGRRNCVLGKMHSYVDVQSSITCSVVGIGHRSPILAKDHGSVWLSKPLGFLKSAYLQSLGHKVDLKSIFNVGTQSAFTAQRAIEMHYIPATDVSGFGLVYALDNLCQRHNVRARIDYSSIRIVDPIVGEVSVECLCQTDGYTPRNVKLFAPTDHISALSEVNGPLILLVEDHIDIVALLPEYSGLHRIGEWTKI